tara:strand:- start:206 stop:454 length:249 start_codon:yes stop_codon:yes gene_type:complete
VDHHKDDDDDEMENYKANASTETRRKWLNMMMTASDGWSDPPVHPNIVPVDQKFEIVHVHLSLSAQFINILNWFLNHMFPRL